MWRELDCRGLACPGPVLRAKQALDSENPSSLCVLVDNSAACENVSRFLESRGFSTKAAAEDGLFKVLASRLAEEAGDCEPSREAGPEDSSEKPQKIMVLCATDRLGFGDDELGLKLMASFIGTLKEMGPDLWRVVLVNNGVKLSVSGSPVLKQLQELEGMGVGVMVCGTCLNHFQLLEKKQVGHTTNMLDIVTSAQLADKVINL